VLGVVGVFCRKVVPTGAEGSLLKEEYALMRAAPSRLEEEKREIRASIPAIIRKINLATYLQTSCADEATPGGPSPARVGLRAIGSRSDVPVPGEARNSQERRLCFARNSGTLALWSNRSHGPCDVAERLGISMQTGDFE